MVSTESKEPGISEQVAEVIEVFKKYGHRPYSIPRGNVKVVIEKIWNNEV